MIPGIPDLQKQARPDRQEIRVTKESKAPRGRLEILALLVMLATLALLVLLALGILDLLARAATLVRLARRGLLGRRAT